MKNSLYITLIIILACHTKNEELSTLDFSAFKITVPYNWKKLELQGIDSFRGGLTNGTDTLTFDYGWYSGNFKGESNKLQLFSEDTINGKRVILTIPKQKNGLIGAHFNKAYKKNKLTIVGYNIENTSAILNYFKTIVFEDSDTSINSKEFDFDENNNPYKGLDIYRQNCASCHHISKEMFGPSLKSIEYIKYKEWVLDSILETDLPDSCCGINYHKSSFSKYLTEDDIKSIIELEL